MATPFKSSKLGSNEGNENRKIFKALLSEKQPLSRRKLSQLTKVEIPSLCRALWNMVHKTNLLTVAQIKPCQFTGKRVYHYYFSEGLKGGFEHE